MKSKDSNIKKVSVRLPARLHIDVMNIQKLHEGKVGGGGIGVAINCNFIMNAEIIENEYDIIESIKPNLVKFYIELFRKHLNIKYRFRVKCEPSENLKSHGGMGSNALVQLGLAYSINYLIGKPLTDKEVIEFLHKNYYEEDNGNITNKVYCSGVAHNTSLYGGVCFVSEDGDLIFNKALPIDVKVAIIKAQFDDIFEEKNIDKDEVIVRMRKERDRIQGINNKEEIIRKIMIEDLKKNKYRAFINGMKKFSREDDSVVLSKRCNINGIPYNEFCENIEKIRNTFVRISSNSPYIYIVSSDMKKIKEECLKNDISLKEYEIDNYGIQVIEG